MKQTIIKIWQVEVNEPSKALCKQVVLDYANKYPPDEVIIERKGKKIVKTLIIETKGAIYAGNYADIRRFMEDTFVHLNANAFDYLYLEDGKDMSYHLQSITDKINAYFSKQT